VLLIWKRSDPELLSGSVIFTTRSKKW
jgi:hypothetical protein